MYELIQHQEVGAGGAASITFSGIPQIYTDLIVQVSARADNADVINGLIFEFNGSSTTYSGRILMGYSGVTNSDTAWVANRRGGQATAANQTANTYSTNQYCIPNYTSSSTKSIGVEFASEGASSYYEMGIGAIAWDGTAPITSLEVKSASGANFVQYTTATLFGVGRKAGIGRQPLASGGYTSFVDGYWVHTFTANGSFKPFVDLDVEYLVVAGGGGGGRFTTGQSGGGGGAGGYRSSVPGEFSGSTSSAESPLSLTASTNYAVTVGAGGAGSTSDTTNGANGNDSVFASITSNKGGGGSGAASAPTGTFGSGGGVSSGGGVYTGASGTPGQGTSGGSNNGSLPYLAGGGGGAGLPGSDGGKVGNSNGGDGLASSINGTLTYRAGGGGGGFRTAGYDPGAGGLGGGGAGGADNSSGENAQIATGSGGGGCADQQTGGNGASGIVIVRYRA